MTLAMASIRLLVSDIDGTLVRDDKTLAEATVAAFARLAAAGIRATLISARPPSGMTSLAETLGLEGPMGAFNGGTIVKPDGTIQSATRLVPAIAVAALALIDVAGVEIWLFADGAWFARDAGHPRVARERLSSGTEPTIVADFADLTARVDKIVAVSDDRPLLAGLARIASDAWSAAATVTQSQPYFLDFTALSANKGDGVEMLASAFGVPLAEVAVIGDMANDLPMFARAGVAIAMGQAPPAVRDAARFVTTANSANGVAHAIDTILLAAR